MIKQVLMAGAILFAVLMLTGCSTTPNTVVLPEKDSKYKVIAFGSSEKDANQSAVAKATDVCKQSGKSMVVLNHASKYQGGLAKGDKELIKAGSEVASLIEGPNHSKVFCR
ncbi:MAG: hypothetical protein KGY41_07010 [Desulfovermiculus sp.]|nr:hypothetical protein [Desulfovermiculus sp.]